MITIPLVVYVPTVALALVGLIFLEQRLFSRLNRWRRRILEKYDR